MPVTSSIPVSHALLTGIRSSLIALSADSNTPITDVTVTECDDGSFCYGTGKRDCCQQGQGVFLDAQGLQVTTTPTATTATSTPSSTPSSTSPASSSTTDMSTAGPPISTSTPEPSSGLSGGAKAGLGAAVGGVVLVAALIVGWLCVRRKKQGRQNSETLLAEQKYRVEAPSYQEATSQNYSRPEQRHEMESAEPSRTYQEAKRSNLAELG